MAAETETAVKTETAPAPAAAPAATASKRVDLKRFLSSMRLEGEVGQLTPMVQNGFAVVKDDVSEKDRFVSGLAALLLNVDRSAGKLDKGNIQDLIARIDGVVNAQVNEIIHHEQFKQLESNWRSLHDLIRTTNFKADVVIDMLDVSKDELHQDFDANSVDITSSALFKKVYVAEYDQFGGKPYGGIIGLYEFMHTPRDEFWLRTMARVAAASHAPFVGAVSPKFFGCENAEELAALKDLEGLMNHPRYGSWNKFRDSEEAAYVGLTLPKYICRQPWDPDTNPSGDMPFREEVRGDKSSDFLWGNASILFAQNMIRSFTKSGWCQYLRGPKGGGLVSGLPVHTFNLRGEEETKIPVEIAIPDYRELEFANAGFIPLIYRKGTADACFFSVQSVKKAKKFKDPKDSENAQLVTNLSYTLSITRIAHYVKSIMRDNIGSSADAIYVQSTLQKWISKYVTLVVNPDDLTLCYYPFKAAQVQVAARPGMIGWYDCKLTVMPHVQFEGLDAELRMDTRL
jgi:type VI secretion system protein ImpC